MEPCSRSSCPLSPRHRAQNLCVFHVLLRFAVRCFPLRRSTQLPIHVSFLLAHARWSGQMLTSEYIIETRVHETILHLLETTAPRPQKCHWGMTSPSLGNIPTEGVPFESPQSRAHIDLKRVRSCTHPLGPEGCDRAEEVPVGIVGFYENTHGVHVIISLQTPPVFRVPGVRDEILHH